MLRVENKCYKIKNKLNPLDFILSKIMIHIYEESNVKTENMQHVLSIVTGLFMYPKQKDSICFTIQQHLGLFHIQASI